MPPPRRRPRSSPTSCNGPGANLSLTQPPVPSPGPGSATGDDGWDTTDVEALRGAEPGQLLHAAEGSAAVATTGARPRPASCAPTRTRPISVPLSCTKRRSGTVREAAQLRGGKLLPLPRPDWAGEGNDDKALGSALDWQPSLSAEARPPLEAALAAAGLLGATLTPTGAVTTAWQVSAEGSELPDNLTAVLTVDPAHPLAATAAAILERVTLASTATTSPGTTALVIGRDGTSAPASPPARPRSCPARPPGPRRGMSAPGTPRGRPRPRLAA